ncbi:MAG: DUF86 domain-containing protein [Deltaproteobacteria bacterium]|nr:DUF86 domain-containing protein [Deltaproteobacteria bacterium]
MVRSDVLGKRLDLLLDVLADLRRYRESVTRERLAAERDTQHMVLHAMYVAAQAVIDIALHALADADRPPGATYRDAFRELASAGLLDAGLANRLEGWAGLRNVLAHHYASVDYGLLHDALVGDLGDLEAFAAAAGAWIDGDTTSSE